MRARLTLALCALTLASPAGAQTVAAGADLTLSSPGGPMVFKLASPGKVKVRVCASGAMTLIGTVADGKLRLDAPVIAFAAWVSATDQAAVNAAIVGFSDGHPELLGALCVHGAAQ